MRVSWESKPLEDLCDILDKDRKPITKKDRHHGPYPYYGATGVVDYVNGYLFDEPLVLLGEDGARWEAGEKSAFAIDGKTWVNNHAHVVRPYRDKILDSWLIYYLNFADLTDFIKGVTVPKLNQARMKNIKIPVPPLEEQQRIVEKLDEVFAGLDEARSNVAANIEDCKELFQSVLHENLKDAEEKGWEARVLGDLCQIELGNTPARRFSKNWDAKKQTDNVWLSIADLPVGYDPWVSDSKEYVSELATKTMKLVPTGTLMVSFKLTLGRVAIAGRDLRTNEAIASMMNLDTSLCSRDYLLWYFRYYDWDHAAEGGEKVKGKTLNKAKLRVLPVVIPPLEEQKNIVNKLNAMRSQIDRPQQEYIAQLSDIDELRQSILQRAFAGELT